MIVRFSVPSAVGKNARLMPAGRRIILTPQARAFMESVALHGLAARSASSWPKNPYAAKRVRLSVDVFNTKHDAAAVSPLVADALEGVFYANDRAVIYGPQELPIKDGGTRRIEVSIELLEAYSEKEALNRIFPLSLKKLVRRG